MARTKLPTIGFSVTGRAGPGCAAGTVVAGPTILGAQDKAGTKLPVTGTGEHTYEMAHDWGQLPATIKYGNTHGVFYPGVGVEAFAGPVGLRLDVGDEMYFLDGAHNNLRIAAGPQFRF